MKNKILPTLLFLILLFLTTRPDRSIAVQDDAAYALASLAIFQGHWAPHPLLLAAAWPQTILGALACHIFPYADPLTVFNLLTFGCFSAVVLLLAGLEFPLTLTLAFCGFPVFFQYGTSFLSEMYVVLPLILWARLALRPSAPALGPVVALLPILVILQRQTALPFIAAISLAALITSRADSAIRRGPHAWSLTGCLLGAVVYLWIPKSILQADFLNFWLQHWRVVGGMMTLVQILTLGGEYILSVGLFLSPLVFYFKWTRGRICRGLAFQGLLVFLLWRSPVDALSAGVLFTNYFRKLFAVGFLSLGVWGIFPLIQLVKERRTLTLESLAIASAVFANAVFNSSVGITDIKYAIPAAVVIWAWLSLRRTLPVMEHSLLAKIFCGLTVGVSILVNAYSLETTDQRWRAAKRYEVPPVTAEQISAGYGRDLYVLGEPCLRRAIHHADALMPADRNAYYRNTIYAHVPRLYEEGWVSRVLIKPSLIFGKTLALTRNVAVGQQAPPREIIPYRVLGIPCALAVFENYNFQPPTCFRSAE